MILKFRFCLLQGWTAQDYRLGYDDGNWLQIDAGSVQGIAGVSIQVRRP